MTESICFSCVHFKQTGPLKFTISGHCGWTSPMPIPQWLQPYVDSRDSYYGPKKEVGKGPYEVANCAAFERAEQSTIDRRKTEDWYD
jgi:hypothetical protein